jgi:hypothetical protein
MSQKREERLNFTGFDVLANSDTDTDKVIHKHHVISAEGLDF